MSALGASLPAHFLRMAAARGAATCLTWHDGATWTNASWTAVADDVRTIAAGLATFGHAAGHALSIFAETQPAWQLVDLANLCLGGVTVGLFPTMTGEQAMYVIAHAESRVLVVGDPAKLATLTPHLSRARELALIVVLAPGDAALPTRVGDVPCVSLAQVRERGRAAGAAAHAAVDASANALAAHDLALLIYTSGTTGPPKGAEITHGNIMAALRQYSCLPPAPDDVGFVFLPLGHVLTRMLAFRSLYDGRPCAFGRSLATVADDLAACRPTLLAAVPRIFEKIYAGVHAQARTSPIKARVFAWAVAIGRQRVAHVDRGQPLPLHLALGYAAARRLVFDKLRARLGGRIRLFVTGGAPIAREILEFFAAADITICEGWGMTETCAAGTLTLPGALHPGTIGPALPGVELRLDHDGELLIRGPNLFRGYHKEPDATRASFTDDGFFRTGDVCTVDARGVYTIVDRKKDLIITAAGKNVAPQNIENHLKADPRIAQVVVIGDRRPYLVALVAVTADARAGKDPAALKREIDDLVAAKNEELASYERIRKVALLPAELSLEAGELTPTLKVKRPIVVERYRALIEQLYDQPRGEPPSS